MPTNRVGLLGHIQAPFRAIAKPLSRHPPDDGLVGPRLPLSADASSSARGSRAPKPVTLARRAPKCGFCCHPDAPLLWFLVGRKTSKRFTSIRLPAAAAVPRSAAGCRQTVFAGCDLGHLECDVAAMADDLRANFDELLFQGRQRPVLDRVRRRQGSQEVAEIVSKRMKLKANHVGGERAA